MIGVAWQPVVSQELEERYRSHVIELTNFIENTVESLSLFQDKISARNIVGRWSSYQVTTVMPSGARTKVPVIPMWMLKYFDLSSDGESSLKAKFFSIQLEDPMNFVDPTQAEELVDETPQKSNSNPFDVNVYQNHIEMTYENTYDSAMVTWLCYFSRTDEDIMYCHNANDVSAPIVYILVRIKS